MLNAWESWYKKGESCYDKGEDVFPLAAEYLADCSRVEDWGCGVCYAKPYFPPGVYVGIDGSPSGGADVTADLRAYVSHSEGLLMRAVLEHNRDWRLILDNFLKSFTRRAILIRFTRLVENDTVRFITRGIPTLNLCRKAFLGPIDPFIDEVETVRYYTIYRLEK